MYFLIWIRKKCRFTLTTDSYKFKKNSDLCQMNYSTNENNTTSKTPQSQRTAELWQAKVSFPPPDCWCSSLLTLENSAIDWQTNSLLWIYSGKTSFFFSSVNLVLGFSAKDINSVGKYSMIFLVGVPITSPTSNNLQTIKNHEDHSAEKK